MQDRCQVMVVEDDFALRRTIADVLLADDHQVICAADGRDALAYLRQGGSPPDLILLDIRMPNVDGMQFLTELRQSLELQEIPVVTMSANWYLPKGLATKAHIVEHLPKPLQVRDLLAIVRTHCRS